MKWSTHKLFNHLKVPGQKRVGEPALHQYRLHPQRPFNSLSPIPIQPKAIPNIIDPNPHREQRALARPRRLRRLRPRALLKLPHLVHKAQHRVLVRRHQLRIRRRAPIRVVVREDEGGVVLRGEVGDPVLATGGGPAGVRGVADGVGGGGELAGGVEPGLGVRVAAGKNI